MKSNHSIAVVLIFSLAVQLSGCSWIHMKRVPEGYTPDQELECDGYTLPVVDLGVMGGILGLGGLAAGLVFNYRSLQVGGYEGMAFGGFMALVGGVFAILRLFSAMTGFCWGHTCNTALELRAEWLKTHPAQMQVASNAGQEALKKPAAKNDLNVETDKALPEASKSDAQKKRSRRNA